MNKFYKMENFFFFCFLRKWSNRKILAAEVGGGEGERKEGGGKERLKNLAGKGSNRMIKNKLAWEKQEQE